MKTYKIKSKFYGWQDVTYKEALEYAKWKIGAITTCKDNNERLELINRNIDGVQFKLKDVL